MENTKKIFDIIQSHLGKGKKSASTMDLADLPELDKKPVVPDPKKPKQSVPVSYKFTDDDPDSVKFSPDMLVDISEKLLNLNRGSIEPDNRDALYYRRAYTPADLLRERIALDADHTMRNVIRKSAYRKNLKHLSSDVFSNYVEGLIVGNPLSMPLEQINPMQMLEQSRRFTQMGPGGIGSADAVTSESQNVDPSEFYFVDTIAGPESERIGIDTRAAWGTRIGSDGKLYQRFFDRRRDAYVWLNPFQTANSVIAFPD